jgi:proteic killer suppression protein
MKVVRTDSLGVFSFDLDCPYRLLFGPECDPVPRKEDGGIDWTRVQAICIRSVEDTHDK